PGPGLGPTKKPVLRSGLSSVERLGSSRAIAETAKAPGSIARMISPAGVAWRPSTPNGSPLRPSATACNAGARVRSSSIGDLHDGRRDAGGDPREAQKRDADPGRPVGRLVADLVGGLFDKE